MTDQPMADYIRPPKRNGDPETHDYTKRGWGHDYTFDPRRGGLEGRMMGWGFGIQEGDFLILSRKDGGSTRYRVTHIQYYRDPPDMWRADVEFAPRPNSTAPAPPK